MYTGAGPIENSPQGYPFDFEQAAAFLWQAVIPIGSVRRVERDCRCGCSDRLPGRNRAPVIAVDSLVSHIYVLRAIDYLSVTRTILS